MRKKLEVAFISLLLFFLFKSPFLFGGNISPNLQLKLNKLKEDEFHSCLLIMKSQVNTAQLIRSAKGGAATTRKERHKEILKTLKTEASSSQFEIINYLQEKIKHRSVKEFKTFWITNSIFLFATKDEIKKVASRNDVETIYEDYPITLVDPVSIEKSSDNQAEKERCFSAIGVREVWSMGYNGQGRLVCNFDTGVDGDHPALFSNWRGNNGGLDSACWYDPYGSDFPKDKKGHGTHTMGIMVGISEDDTIGVAFGAQWISAAVIDQGAGLSQTISDILSAFEWAIDPDGNPETIADVPDVISNSWGIPPGYKPACDQTFWTAIDNVENAGIVVIFAAGNEGPDPSTLRTPADRITSPLNCFSVGAVDANSSGYPVASFSSRGPSGCDGQTKKPEVCAPGVKVLSCYPDGQYRLMTGTSMAAPFVAGAVAILRQYNPDATVDEVKGALLESASDLGPPGEDNSYGWGLINIKRALELLPKPNFPNLYLKDFLIQGGDFLHPGDHADIIVNLKNTGRDVRDVFAILSTSDSLTQITLDSVFFGEIAKGEEVSNVSCPFQVNFDENMPQGRKVNFLLNVFGDTPEYSCVVEFSITVGSLPSYSLGNHDVGNFVFTISNFGQYGLGDHSFNPLGGVGFIYPQNGSDLLYEASFLIGRSPDQVSDGARNDDGKTPAQDFEVFPGGELILNTPGTVSHQDGFCIFSDLNAEDPLGFRIMQKSFSYADPENDDYLILEYVIHNMNQEPVEDFYAGLFFDWDIPLNSPDDDKIGFDSTLSLYYQYDSKTNLYLSVVPLGVNFEDELISSSFNFMTQIDNSLWLYDGFTEEEKYLLLSGGLVTNSDGEEKDWSQITSCGPFSLAPQESVVVAFAVVGGEGLDEFQTNVVSAKGKYLSIATNIENEDDKNRLPEDFYLGQNFPNPFNPTTAIPFELRVESKKLRVPRPSERNEKFFTRRTQETSSIYTSLKIYNIRGQLVKTIFEGSLPAGRYEVMWDGKDESGAEVSSGVYLYRLKTGPGTTTRKMILLK
ncbi:MAG: S8 family serine peptidase [candidate division Zixibacteria bacterium]|nr:S8 family serine peptidase [candidate division Zixibacteria bacterium]